LSEWVSERTLVQQNLHPPNRPPDVRENLEKKKEGGGGKKLAKKPRLRGKQPSLSKRKEKGKKKNAQTGGF